MDASFFKNNREQLAKMMKPGSIAIIPGTPILNTTPENIANFHQDNQFYYLSGIKDPNAAIAIIKHKNKPLEYIVFCPKEDSQLVPWLGRGLSQEDAMKQYGADKAYSIAEVDKDMPSLLLGRKTIYHPFDSKVPFSKKIKHWRDQTQTMITWDSKKATIPIETKDVAPLIGILRQKKTKEEVEHISKAAQVTSHAFNRTLSKFQAGMSEFNLARIFESACKRESEEHTACPTIVACGSHAGQLYHPASSSCAHRGDLVVVQGGAKIQDYSSVIARTFPASGYFDKNQEALYEVALKAQAEGLKYLKSGQTLVKIETKMLKVIADGLRDLGIIPDEQMSYEKMKRFVPGDLVNHVGLDAIDPDIAKPGLVCPKLKKHMVVSVSVNLCIPEDDEQVACGFRGLSVRLADTAEVTTRGHRLLTEAPKTVLAIERTMRKDDLSSSPLLVHYNQLEKSVCDSSDGSVLKSSRSSTDSSTDLEDDYIHDSHTSCGSDSDTEEPLTRKVLQAV